MMEAQPISMGPTLRAYRNRQLLAALVVVVGLAAAPAAAAPLTREFRYPAERLKTTWNGETVAVAMKGASSEGVPGRPDLPVVAEPLELPAGYRARSVTVEEIDTAPIAAQARVAPISSPLAGAGAVRADARAYGSVAPSVELGYQGSMRGRARAWLLVRPVRWDPVGGRLDRIARLKVKVEIEPEIGSDVVRRERIVREWENDPVEVADARVVSATPTGAIATPFKATQVPSVLGSPVAYVIVTSDLLAAEFQRLADWKTQSGVPAVVRTVSFIRQQYPDGADDADRIRRFLRDAYARWGTVWVLLGGDPDQVPERVVYSSICLEGECTTPPMNDIVSDAYYSCLDGNWNADGDKFYGEGGSGGDQCDLLPEVYVGRAPVSTVVEAAKFIDRTFQYTRTPVGDYEHQTLFFSEVLFPQNWTPGQSIVLDGAEASEACLPPMMDNPGVRSRRLYENYLDPRWVPGALQESRVRVLDSLSAGYNLAVHTGHGYRNVASCADANLTNMDALGLTNGNRLMNTYMANCTSNAIDYPCLGKSLLNAANGGSVTNIGSTRVDFPAIGMYFQAEYFRLLFDDGITAIGEAQAKQKVPFVGSASSDNAYRWTIQTLLLLGDPELRLWLTNPKNLAVTHPSSVGADVNTLNVTVTSGGLPLAGARVTAYKVNDEYRIGTTNASGQTTLSFRPDGTGSFTLTVTAAGHRPYQAVIPITAVAAPVLADQALVVDDDAALGTNGNGNSIVEAGETVDLRVPLKNNGGGTANSVSATLSTTDPLVTITTSGNSYGNVLAGATANGTGWFRFSTPFGAGDQREIPFTLTATDATPRTYVETFQVVLRAPEMRHVSHVVAEVTGNGNGLPEVGETVTYAVRLRNVGTGTASGVTAVLRCYGGQATVTDSTASFGTLAGGAEVTGDVFRFNVTAPGAVFELRVSTSFGLLSVHTADLSWPAAPAGLAAQTGPASIQLTWAPNAEPDLVGYLLYRSTSAGGPFTLVTPLPTDETSFAVDPLLSPLTRYYYKVAAVDGSANISAQSAAAFASTNPPAHGPFPIQMGVTASNTQSPVTVARIRQPAGRMDILAGANVLYNWNPDGTGAVDADLQPSTVGDFTTQGGNYAGGATVGDVDGGGLDVVAATWDTKKIFLFDTQGQVKAGWPFTAAFEMFSTPAVWDLDNDGKREILVASNGNHLYVLRWNGTEWMDGDANPVTQGVFKTLGSSYNYATPAIADVDANGQPDILFGSFDGKLYGWRPNGANLPGFPIVLGGSINSSVAIGYLDGTGDAQMDIVVAAGNGDDSLYVFLPNGARRSGFPVYARTGGGYGKSPSPALADVNGDGFLDIVMAGTDGVLRVFDRNGALLPAFANVRYSVLQDAATESSPVVADIDGVGGPDIVIGDDNGVLSGFDSNGQPLPGFPIQLHGEVKGTPALCDCDGDGMSEIVVAGWDARVYVWDYDRPFSPGGTPPWPQFAHDPMHTGFASATTVLDTPGVQPIALRLMAAAPNPAVQQVRLGYEIPSDRAGQALEVDVFDLAGRKIRRLAEGISAAGRYPLTWDLRAPGSGRVSAGVYLIRLRVGEAVESQRVVVMP
jgi:hypothetical protein